MMFRHLKTEVNSVMETLIEQFENSSIGAQASFVFLQEINYICDSVINYYHVHNFIYTDVLDILCHCGHDLAYDVSSTFEQDCEWFKNHGKNYVYNYVVSKIHFKVDDVPKMNELITKIYEVYNI